MSSTLGRLETAARFGVEDGYKRRDCKFRGCYSIRGRVGTFAERLRLKLTTHFCCQKLCNGSV